MGQYIPFPADSKSWDVETISTHAARPARCPRCGVASRVPGRRLMLHGHGRRERQQQGPPRPESSPDTHVVVLRRYRCLACRTVVCVGPRDVAPRYLYSGPAIAWAVALFGIACLSNARVRQKVSIWRRVGATAQGRWNTLYRWLRDNCQGRLFADVVLHHAAAVKPRYLAEKLATSIAARAPPSLQALAMTERIFKTPQVVWLGASI